MNKQQWIAILVLAAATTAQAKYDPNHFDPDNAAHWYRKAFELYEEPNDIGLSEYIRFKTGLSPEIEQYLKSQKSVIELLNKAADIEHCDWQFDPWAEDRYVPTYFFKAKRCPDLLLSNARYRGNKREASTLIKQIENYLIFTQRLDFGESMSYLHIIFRRATIYQFLQDYLNCYPDCPVEHLHAVRQLLQREQTRKYCSNIDLIDHKIKVAKVVLNEPTKHFPINNRVWELLLNPEQNTVGQAFYQKNYQCYEDYVEKAKQAVSLPYPQAVEKIRQIEKVYRDKWDIYIKRFQDFSNDYKATQEDCDYTQQFDFVFTVWMESIYYTKLSRNPLFLDYQTRAETQLNALLAGLDLLIAYRQTKVVPNSMPPEAPKDLFSEKAFLIIITDKGFKLKCQGKSERPFGNKIEYDEYEFVLPEEK